MSKLVKFLTIFLTALSRIIFLLVDTDLTPEDPRWVGAWWLGFVILGSGAIITSVPTFFFPAGRKPPEQMTKPQEKMTINNSDKIEESNDESCCSYFKGKFIIKWAEIFLLPQYLSSRFTSIRYTVKETTFE